MHQHELLQVEILLLKLLQLLKILKDEKQNSHNGLVIRFLGNDCVILNNNKTILSFFHVPTVWLPRLCQCVRNPQAS